MIDLHTHCFFSDGELVPAEHLRRVEVLGYEQLPLPTTPTPPTWIFSSHALPRQPRISPPIQPLGCLSVLS